MYDDSLNKMYNKFSDTKKFINFFSQQLKWYIVIGV